VREKRQRQPAARGGHIQARMYEYMRRQYKLHLDFQFQIPKVATEITILLSSSKLVKNGGVFLRLM